MKKTLFVLHFILLSISAQAIHNSETWAYLYHGEEKYFPNPSPITDVACFSAKVDGDGHLKGGHLAPPTLPGARQNTRYHLVITIPWNPTLAHIYLNPTLPFRARIISDIIKRSAPFDGIQVDFEGIRADDKMAYLSFLTAVKKELSPQKLFSVAVMARWETHKKKHPDDAFDYASIGKIADRIIIMAYDEHYGGGAAGPIASLPWCQSIFDHAQKTIPSEKIIMGIPLYGRGWQIEKPAKSFRNREIWTNIRINQPKVKSSPSSGGSYSYATNVTIKVHFESMPSLNAKMDLYASRPIKGMAFWRIGQEPINFWSHISNHNK